MIKVYNNNSFDISLFIYNSEISLTSPGQDDISNSCMIMPDDILYMAFENSIESMVPTAEFQINDRSHAISNRLKAQNTKINVVIHPPAISETQFINLTFIVNEYHVLETTPERTVYRILCDLDNAIPLNTTCEYATSCRLDKDAESMENPYEIARKILIKSRLSSISDNRDRLKWKLCAI